VGMVVVVVVVVGGGCRTNLQIPDCTENTELDSCLKSGFYTIIVEFN